MAQSKYSGATLTKMAQHVVNEERKMNLKVFTLISRVSVQTDLSPDVVRRRIHRMAERNFTND